MKKVMIFSEQDGKQLVSDYEQLIAHMTYPNPEDSAMLGRVTKVEPQEVALVEKSELKQVLEALDFTRKYVSDEDNKEICTLIKRLEGKL